MLRPSDVISLQQNRYLWVHFAGLAAVPLLLDVCLAGLASSRTAVGTTLPLSPQFWAIALIGIVPTLWMQWQRPFYLFSLVPLALKPAALSDDQRRCLRLLKSWQIKALAAITAGFSLWVLWQLAEKSLQITPLTAPAPGLAVATISFFLFCVFLQVPVSAARLLLVGQKTLQRVAPYEESAIAPNFLILGLRVNRILPVPATLPDVPESQGLRSREPEEQEAEKQETGVEVSVSQKSDRQQSDRQELTEPEVDLPDASVQLMDGAVEEALSIGKALSTDSEEINAAALSVDDE
ncbi:MAG: low-complexity tail membrane protein, partial [Phormidesmis sp.]